MKARRLQDAAALWLATFVGLLLLFAVVHRVHADTTNVTITFTPPTQWDDGSVLAATDIAGYVLAYTVNGAAQPDIQLPATPAAYVFSGVTVAKYCVRLATKATNGSTGPYSAEVCRKPRAKPPVVVIN